MRLHEITEGYWKKKAIDMEFDQSRQKPKKTVTKYAVYFNYNEKYWKIFDTYEIAIDRANKVRIKSPKLRADIRPIEVEI